MIEKCLLSEHWFYVFYILYFTHCLVKKMLFLCRQIKLCLNFYVYMFSEFQQFFDLCQKNCFLQLDESTL